MEMGGDGFYEYDQSTLYEILKHLKTFKKQINKIILPLPPALECTLGLRIFLYNERNPHTLPISGSLIFGDRIQSLGFGKAIDKYHLNGQDY